MQHKIYLTALGEVLCDLNFCVVEHCLVFARFKVPTKSSLKVIGPPTQGRSPTGSSRRQRSFVG